MDKTSANGNHAIIRDGGPMARAGVAAAAGAASLTQPAAAPHRHGPQLATESGYQANQVSPSMALRRSSCVYSLPWWPWRSDRLAHSCSLSLRS